MTFASKHCYLEFYDAERNHPHTKKETWLPCQFKYKFIRFINLKLQSNLNHNLATAERITGQMFWFEYYEMWGGKTNCRSNTTHSIKMKLGVAEESNMRVCICVCVSVSLSWQDVLYVPNFWAEEHRNITGHKKGKHRMAKSNQLFSRQ